MVELFSRELLDDGRRSSKGNQLKWKHDSSWFKADYAGYEGLAEYMVSSLLAYSTLTEEEYVHYDTERIVYKGGIHSGCRSEDFLHPKTQLITLERLFRNQFGQSLYISVFRIENPENRLEYLVRQVQRITGIKDAGSYFTKMLTIDAFFLNEDRHTHNIAVIADETGRYRFSPFFDHGASLLSDTRMDYPLGGDLYKQIDAAKAKTVSEDFDEQLFAAEKLFGQQLQFTFSKKTVNELLEAEPYYPEEIKNRVRTILFDRMRKYSHMFPDTSER